jgi:glutathione S-transferase
MKLHTVQGSPNGHKVEAVIHHLGLQVEIEHHDIFNGGLSRPEYLSINPNAMVPTLVDGDFVLWEANVIMQYLAEKAGGDELLPRDVRQRADVARWQQWEAVHFNYAFGSLAFETVAKPGRGMSADARVVESASKNLARFAPVLDQHLQGRHYVAADRLTVADYSLLTFESYRGRVPFDWSGYRHINAYFDRLRGLDAWVNTLPARKAA